MEQGGFMRRAIALSCQGVTTGGSPFGAVVVREILAWSWARGATPWCPAATPPRMPRSWRSARPAPALGAPAASRRAVVYTGARSHCPMCLERAVWWARIAEVVYGNDRADAAAIGFDDAAIYDEVCLPLPARRLPLRRLLAAEAIEGFRRVAGQGRRGAC